MVVVKTVISKGLAIAFVCAAMASLGYVSYLMILLTLKLSCVGPCQKIVLYFAVVVLAQHRMITRVLVLPKQLVCLWKRIKSLLISWSTSSVMRLIQHVCVWQICLRG